ncbi:2-hydroxy-3-oxopropionate reductase-like [Lineus longissimus]|uniref:2-hydroxy-3-oxopropionate reductase-like n=1 Tax=Lineus longissimus TaxID=88925 RepID=UPI00315CF8DE
MHALRTVVSRSLSSQCRRFATAATSGEKKLDIGVVGAGQIGRAVCLGLRKKGHNVKVCDPNRVNHSELVNNGVTWLAKAREVCEGADVLITAVPAPPHVRKVMEEEGVLENMKDGACWIDHTTTDKDETMRLSAIAKSRGLNMLEAPLTGGLELLKAGQMTVLVGGDKQVLDRYERIIRSYTETVLHMGDIGTASVVKVLSNMLAGAHTVLSSEAVMMAKRHGVNLQAFFDGIRASAGNSYVFETEVPLMFNGTYDPGFKIALHNKDFSLGRQLAMEAKVPLELMGLTEQIYLRAMYKYGEDVGSSMPAKLLPDDLNEEPEVKGYEGWTYEIQKVEGGGIAVVHRGVKKTE